MRIIMFNFRTLLFLKNPYIIFFCYFLVFYLRGLNICGLLIKIYALQLQARIPFIYGLYWLIPANYNQARFHF